MSFRKKRYELGALGVAYRLENNNTRYLILHKLHPTIWSFLKCNAEGIDGKKSIERRLFDEVKLTSAKTQKIPGFQVIRKHPTGRFHEYAKQVLQVYSLKVDPYCSVRLNFRSNDEYRWANFVTAENLLSSSSQSLEALKVAREFISGNNNEKI